MAHYRSGTQIGAWKVDSALSFGEPALLAVRRTDAPDVEAILQVQPEHARSQAWRDRTVAALKSLDHPSIPKLVDAGRTGDLGYLAFQPFGAETLADRLLVGPVDRRLACTWLFAWADALRALHASGWVHGDVAPQHLHVAPEGGAWLMGLGSAQRLGEALRAASELPERTLTHLAPEVLADPDHSPPRADIYAFGTVAYELLAGEPAFPATAWADRPDQQRLMLEWKSRHRELDPGPEHPDWLRALVRKCTHPDPGQRLPDFETIVAWLEASKPSWEIRPAEPGPAPVSRSELPVLRLRPTLVDAEGLARAIALEVRRQPPPVPRADLYILVSAAAGLGAGLAISFMLIAYVELSWLA